MATSGLKNFQSRHNISGQMTQMIGAGLVALAVLVAAAIAIPVRGTNTSTTQAGSVTPTGPDAGGSTSTEPGTIPASAASTPANAGAAVTGSSRGAGGATPANTTTGVSSFGAKPSTFVAANAPGITKDTIYIGVGYSSQAAAGDRAIGAAGAAPSYDTRNVFNATIDYANKHGGFAGRKLKALYYDYNLTTDFNTQDQSACAYWTQDNKVFLMLGGNEILNSCGQRAGALLVGAGPATSATYKKYPNLISPDEIAFDRLGFVTVSGLKNGGYFTGKLGFVTWDDPQYKLAWTQGYSPAFKRFNVKVDQTAYIMVPQQIGALGDMTAAVSSAVAKFKSLGIDHVIIQDGPAGVWSGTGLTFEWMNQAKSQNYYPRYGQNTYNSPGWDVLPADQMNNALAIDQSDYALKFDEGWKVNKFREDCFKIQSDAGYPPDRNNLNDQAIAGVTCDITFMLQRVVNSLSNVTVANVVEAVQHLGTSMPSALVYGTKLFPGRRDGGNMVRTSQYYSSCRCLKFKGKPYYSD